MTTTFSILVPLLAAFFGATAAFVFQNRAEKKREKKQILGIIMAYRGRTAQEDDFVKALNMIDIFFYDNKKVRELCHDYFKHLWRPLFETGHHNKILLELILAMAKDLGYKRLTHADLSDYYFPERYVQKASDNDDKGIIIPPSAN